MQPTSVNEFIDRLRQDYPQFKFQSGKQEHWSPRFKTITYKEKGDAARFKAGVLHELAHGLLGHSSYGTDFELIKLESQAWNLAAKIGKKYGVKISDEHIQNCLDTYRDWLHRRSACPTCGTHVVQSDSSTYKCYNCRTVWHVSSGRFVRPYRKLIDTKNA